MNRNGGIPLGLALVVGLALTTVFPPLRSLIYSYAEGKQPTSLDLTVPALPNVTLPQPPSSEQAATSAPAPATATLNVTTTTAPAQAATVPAWYISLDWTATRALLDGLTVANERNCDKYDRDGEWPQWYSVGVYGDGDPVTSRGGFDARNFVLASQSIDRAATVNNAYEVIAGRWLDPYTGKIIDTPDYTKNQIDHNVSVKEACQSAPDWWGQNERVRFVNGTLAAPGTDAFDLPAQWAAGMNLVAVDGSQNQSRGDREPGAWLPPNPAARCPLIGNYIRVKARFGFSVDRNEKTWLVKLIDICAAGAIPERP